MLSLCLFGISAGVMAFVIVLSQISPFFSCRPGNEYHSIESIMEYVYPVPINQEHDNVVRATKSNLSNTYSDPVSSEANCWLQSSQSNTRDIYTVPVFQERNSGNKTSKSNTTTISDHDKNNTDEGYIDLQIYQSPAMCTQTHTVEACIEQERNQKPYSYEYSDSICEVKLSEDGYIEFKM